MLHYNSIFVGPQQKQLMETNLNAARASFLPDDEKDELIRFLEQAYSQLNIDSF